MVTTRGGVSAPNDCNNFVFLRGRLAAAPQTLELPSGDEICSFRIVVDRNGPGRVKVDTVDCRTATRRVRGVLERAAPGAELQVEGTLRRRFWRGVSGVQSRYEVDVSEVKTGRARG